MGVGGAGGRKSFSIKKITFIIVGTERNIYIYRIYIYIYSLERIYYLNKLARYTWILVHVSTNLYVKTFR